MTTITGKIAAFLDKSTVVINKGAADGVNREDEFYVYTIIGPFVDPDTGEDLGTTKKILGRVEVTIVEERFCVAEMGWVWRKDPINIAMLNNFLGEKVQLELPISSSDLKQRWQHDVKVGTSVVSVAKSKALESNKPPALPDNSLETPNTIVDIAQDVPNHSAKS